jgi:hypothetical protein
VVIAGNTVRAGLKPRYSPRGYDSQMARKFSKTAVPSAVWATSGCH